MSSPNPTEPVTIEVATGDIGRTAVEGGPWLAVVSSDDSMLSHGGGSSASIWEAAGEIASVSYDDLLPARLGSVVRTDAGDLDAAAVLHAVTIDVDTRLRLDPVEYAAMMDELGRALRQAAVDSGFAESRPLNVLIPVVGTGAGEIPFDLAIRLIEGLATLVAPIRLVLATELTFNGFFALIGQQRRDSSVRYRSWRRQPRISATATSASRLRVDADWEHSLGVPLARGKSRRSSSSPERTPDRPREMSRLSAAHTHQAPHVERLVDLLDGLDGAEAGDLDEWMDSLGYKGGRRLRLKELCIRQEPQDILMRFGAARLRGLLRSEFDLAMDAQMTPLRLADRLLSACGFKGIPEPRGLESALADITRLKPSLGLSESHDRAGIVLEVAGRLERVVGDLLRFLCLQIHGAGPERHLKGRANYDGRALSSVTLGMLLTLQHELAKEIDSSESGVVADLNGPVTSERVIPADFSRIMGAITPIRNAFAHASEEQGGHTGAETSLDSAREFLKLTEDLLVFWRDTEPRIYPQIVLVETITIDRWNRRLIMAKTDAGAEEAIVCDHEIHPGRLYYMLPRTNPFRVDPILVEFGRADVKD